MGTPLVTWRSQPLACTERSPSMDDTAPVLAVTTSQATLHLPLLTLAAAFATVPDPRRAQGRRFSLPALLSLLVAGLLCNHLSVLAIAEWGQTQAPAVQAAL